MGTEVLRVLDRPALDTELARAGAILREGGLVAFPTETVYGIAVSALQPDAVELLYALKKRPRDKPMSVMVAGVGPVLERTGELPQAARSLMKHFWPGPLTLVLPADMSIESERGQEVSRGMIGFRLPAHPLARGLVEAAGVPLLVPSANPADLPPATTADEVLAYYPQALDLVIDGGPVTGGTSSTVVRVDPTKPRDEQVDILREGAIPAWRIHQPDLARLLFVCEGNTDRSALAAAIARRRVSMALGCAEDELESQGLTITSAGLAAEVGHRASAKARTIAQQAFRPPLDLDGHRSRKVTEQMVEEASRIFCMERTQREEILAFFPHRVRDVLLLDPEGEDIADPVGMSLVTYERLAMRLDAAASLIAAGLRTSTRS